MAGGRFCWSSTSATLHPPHTLHSFPSLPPYLRPMPKPRTQEPNPTQRPAVNIYTHTSIHPYIPTDMHPPSSPTSPDHLPHPKNSPPITKIRIKESGIHSPPNQVLHNTATLKHPDRLPVLEPIRQSGDPPIGIDLQEPGFFLFVGREVDFVDFVGEAVERWVSGMEGLYG